MTAGLSTAISVRFSGNVSFTDYYKLIQRGVQTLASAKTGGGNSHETRDQILTRNEGVMLVEYAFESQLWYRPDNVVLVTVRLRSLYCNDQF